MDTLQFQWTSSLHWQGAPTGLDDAQLVLAFASTPFFQTQACFDWLRQRFPQALIVGCSSAGDIAGAQLVDDAVVVTAVRLHRSRVRLARARVDEQSDDEPPMRDLITSLQADDLRHVWVVSDGQLVNGTHLAQALGNQGVLVSGGLAGDGTQFGETWVMANEPAARGIVVAIGFYGDIDVKTGCYSGWKAFGVERRITKSSGNVVHTIDDQPALALYKKYLGELAQGLPGSGLRFPLSITTHDDSEPIIRALLGVDEDTQSLRFAGDVPTGVMGRLMHAQFDDLVDSAGLAAQSAAPRDRAGASLGLVVSCVGRRLVLGAMAEDELEMVQSELGPNTCVTGFYSYGELAPHGELLQCSLHNQTITLTTLSE